MMPVIRVSNDTWERLKSHARPFEDKPEDVVNLALDALDQKLGRRAFNAPATIKAGHGNKLPQKEFRVPLLKTLLEFGGSANVSRIRKTMEQKMAPKLGEVDYLPVSTGDPRWWNATCWMRNDLLKEGLIRSDTERGVWALSDEGKKAARASQNA
jgi:hypothetical protein